MLWFCGRCYNHRESFLCVINLAIVVVNKLVSVIWHIMFVCIDFIIYTRLKHSLFVWVLIIYSVQVMASKLLLQCQPVPTNPLYSDLYSGTVHFLYVWLYCGCNLMAAQLGENTVNIHWTFPYLAFAYRLEQVCVFLLQPIPPPSHPPLRPRLPSFSVYASLSHFLSLLPHHLFSIFLHQLSLPFLSHH